MKRILSGEQPTDIPVIEDSSHNYVFNYENLKQFNIDLKTLPKGLQIVNQSPIYYVISRKLIWCVIAVVMIILTIGLFFISFNINKCKLAKRLLCDSKSLLGTLINSTPNMVYFKSFDGKFLEINNTALNILSINEKDYKNIIESSNISNKK